MVRFKVKPGQADAFTSLMTRIKDSARAEPGCIAYSMQQSLEDPELFVFVEEWTSEQALADHMTMPYVQEITPALIAMMAAEPVVDRFRAVW